LDAVKGYSAIWEVKEELIITDVKKRSIKYNLKWEKYEEKQKKLKEEAEEREANQSSLASQPNQTEEEKEKAAFIAEAEDLIDKIEFIEIQKNLDMIEIEEAATALLNRTKDIVMSTNLTVPEN
jgi:seryl-tRNA synthetase